MIRLFFSWPQWPMRIVCGKPLYDTLRKTQTRAGPEWWRTSSLHLLCALLQVPGVMSQSQRLLKSRRQPQANRRNGTNLLHTKVFTLHPSLRNAEIPLGGQKGAYRNILWGEQPECSDFQKICHNLLVQFLFPWGHGSKILYFSLCRSSHLDKAYLGSMGEHLKRLFMFPVGG